MRRRCPKCQAAYAEPIRFCEQDGTRLTALDPERSKPPCWALAACLVALVAVGCGAWFGLREYVARTVTLDLTELRPPMVRTDGKGFVSEAGQFGLKLAIANQSRVPIRLTAASFEIEIDDWAMRQAMTPKEQLPRTIEPGRSLALSVDSGVMGSRQFTSSSYQLKVSGRYRAEVWGLPIEFPGVALARVRIGGK